MAGCVRFGFGDSDSITPRLFLAVALQTVDQLMEKQSTLFSTEQIQLLSHDVHPTVRVDFEGATKYKDFYEANVEPDRVNWARHTLLMLAEDGQLEGPSIAPLKTSMGSMCQLRDALLESYKTLEPSGNYKSLFWKGVCRPMLWTNTKGRLMAASDAVVRKRGYVCSRCELGGVVSLPAWNSVINTATQDRYGWRGIPWRDFMPEDLRLPLREWVARGGEFTPRGQWPTGNDMRFVWPQEIEHAKGRIQTEAKKQGVKCDEYPWEATFMPRDESIRCSGDRAKDGIYATMLNYLRVWRVANLGDLIKSYRFSIDVIHPLEMDARRLIYQSKESGDNYYIGSYAQTYVVLEGADSAEASRLRLATVPYCLIAKDSKDASARQKAFWKQVRIDAGCDVYK
ncbi:hypothetical protein GNI_182530 [Gregarina niphandrodes]|uniref:Uncharacterized protein n=1 Tax=Gregarina niphandrodes TaxID=110365 RepID=A0A023AY42_GRENI|nr:hypothetical protein GNI_182530 [Gregarina niphandrodes]EZG43210.1 hypothetical protein GNI_182530 [Gregarina niphandrodes]|eukprot:XP_011133533.1 hypothetical protein GNI_182530 [Gregarina niphandrodes]